jgi:hypothetical protein
LQGIWLLANCRGACRTAPSRSSCASQYYSCGSCDGGGSGSCRFSSSSSTSPNSASPPPPAPTPSPCSSAAFGTTCEGMPAFFAGVGGLALALLCCFPLVAFFIGWCLCVQPKAKEGKSPSGTAWVSCCAVFWIVCVFGLFLTGGWGWIVGGVCMMIPFAIEDCYTGVAGYGQTTIVVQNTTSPMMQMQAPMQMMPQMQMQMQMQQGMPMQQPMQLQQPVTAVAVPYQPPAMVMK